MTPKQKHKGKEPGAGIDPQEIFEYWESTHTEVERRDFFGEHYEVIEKMISCRNPKRMGYHKYACKEHPKEFRVVPHTCKTRICGKCAKIQNDTWAEEMKERLPVTEYFHITLTMPEEFRTFFGEEDINWKRKSDIYELGWKAIQGYFTTQNCITGCMIVLHTFGRAALPNPHLHVILLGGGLRKAEKEKTGYKYKKHEYIPKEYIRSAWQRNLLQYVLQGTPSLSSYEKEIMILLKKRNNYAEFAEISEKIMKIIRQNTSKDHWDKWEKVIIDLDYYINIKKKGTKAKESANYAARYTKRLPIPKSKILEFDKENETVKWFYDPHDQPSPVTTTLSLENFILRLMQHIPPKNFRIVRYYGTFATKHISHFIEVLKSLFSFEIPERIPNWRERQKQYTGIDPLECPCCHKEMILTEKAYIASSKKLKIITVKKQKAKKPSTGELCLDNEIYMFLGEDIPPFKVNLDLQKNISTLSEFSHTSCQDFCEFLVH